MRQAGQHLIAHARAYVNNLPPRREDPRSKFPDPRNVFAMGPYVLEHDPWFASTTCSSFVTGLIAETFDLPVALFKALFGSGAPRARDYFNTIHKGLLGSAPLRVTEIQEGDIGVIRYDAAEDGMTGHVFIIAGKPVPTGEVMGSEVKVYKIPVVDSCRSSHGPGDSRFTPEAQHGGIGEGFMRILVHGSGVVTGYMWRGEGTSEVYWSGYGQDIVIGKVPDGWKVR